MDSTVPDEWGVKWRKPLIAVSAAIFAILALLIYSPGFGVLAGVFLVVPIAVLILLVLLVSGKGRTKLLCFAVLCLFGLISWQMIHHSDSIRSEARWLIVSRYWKDKVLRKEPEPGLGMKCVIWDGWGMFAQDTDVGLIYSPNDGLRNYSPTNLNGLPYPVWRVQRLEKNWYSVIFYTNDTWDYCGLGD